MRTFTEHGDELALVDEVVDAEEGFLDGHVGDEHLGEGVGLVFGVRDREVAAIAFALLEGVDVVLAGAVELVEAELVHVLVAFGHVAHSLCGGRERKKYYSVVRRGNVTFLYRPPLPGKYVRKVSQKIYRHDLWGTTKLFPYSNELKNRYRKGFERGGIGRGEQGSQDVN